MKGPSFWTRERQLPGQAPVEDAVGLYWRLKLLHPPSTAAMLLGAIGFGVVAWRLSRDANLIVAIVVAGAASLVGAGVGLLVYWLARLIFALNE